VEKSPCRGNSAAKPAEKSISISVTCVIIETDAGRDLSPRVPFATFV